MQYNMDLYNMYCKYELVIHSKHNWSPIFCSGDQELFPYSFRVFFREILVEPLLFTFCVKLVITSSLRLQGHLNLCYDNVQVSLESRQGKLLYLKICPIWSEFSPLQISLYGPNNMTLSYITPKLFFPNFYKE